MNAKDGAAFALFRTDLQPKNLLITFDALAAQLVVTIAKNSRNCGPHLKRRTLCALGLCSGARESGEFPAESKVFLRNAPTASGKENHCAFFQKILDQCAISVIIISGSVAENVLCSYFIRLMSLGILRFDAHVCAK